MCRGIGVDVLSPPTHLYEDDALHLLLHSFGLLGQSTFELGHPPLGAEVDDADDQVAAHGDQDAVEEVDHHQVGVGGVTHAVVGQRIQSGHHRVGLEAREVGFR